MPQDIGPEAIASRADDGIATELLTDHAEQVATRAAWLTTESARLDSEAASLIEPVGRLHDAGKAVPAFQRYLRNEYTGERKYTYHARLGAFAVAHVLAERGASRHEQLAGWAAILRHHGQLPDLVDETIRVLRAEWNSDNDAWVEEQIDRIDEAEASRNVFDTLLRTASDGTTDWATFHEAMANRTVHGGLLKSLGLRPERPRKGLADPATVPDRTYDITLRLWSNLTLADKTISSGSVTRDHLRPETLSQTALENHISDLLTDSGVDDARVEAATGGSVQPDDEASLNALREAARRRVKQTAPELTDHEIGILTLPTGLGKTFSGLSGAFALRDELQRARERETAPRIIYALPYTSIIEQTREIFETEVFEADPRGQAFTTHHYLAETVTYPNTETELGSSPDTDHAASRAKLLGESWRSGVVLTTFVQLFESLAGPSNAAGLKLPALHDAVIVLDEPQAVPKPWWDAIRRLTRTLIDTYDARVISMTATQPTLFTAGSFDTTSLLHTGAGESFQRQAYESVSRVRYYVDDSVRSLLKGDQGKPLGHGLAANRLLERALQPADEDSPTSVLAVCSTVASSRGLTEEVVEQAPAAGTQATHIGDAYRSALASLDKFDPEAQSDTHPKPEQLAHETLERLGFVKDETDTWRPGDGWTGHLLVGTFNARYRPLDRRALIHIADALSTAAVPFVFISTQAIEAGVDISFNHAYRDVAPLDSIVQTAGRCNRSFEWGVDGGTTTVWCLASPNDEETTLPAQYIYREAGHLSEIASLLHDVSDGTEEPIPAATLELETVQKYFDFVESRGFLDDDLKPWIEDSEAEKLGRKSLLGDEYETVDILVAATEADNKRLDHLRQQFAKYEGLGYERLNELSDMRVSVSIREMDDLSMHTRADGTGRQSNSGVDVFVHELGHGNGSYEFDAGFLVTESDVTNRFT